MHARAAEVLPDVKLVAVCDLQMTVAAKVAGTVDAIVYTNYRKMYSEARLDAVIVNTPHALHLEMVLAAAEAGIHVLVEKPMATKLADCDRMSEACRRAGVTLVVGHIQHFLPEKVAAEELLRSGKLGKLLMVRDFRSTDYRPGTRPEWFFSPTIAGGGALMNIGGHCIDRSLWFAGSAVETVTARCLSRFGVAVETDGHIVLGLANGVNVDIVVVSDPPHRLDEVLLICEYGSISVTPDRGTVVREDGSNRTVLAPAADNIQAAFTAQLADFIRALHGGKPKVGIDHARTVVETVLAAYDSAISLETVTLPYPLPLPYLEGAL
jgi:phthalate 4,5-cis-dihydrodiol dehydrogenase